MKGENMASRKYFFLLIPFILCSCSSVNGTGSSKPAEDANVPKLRIEQTAGVTTIKQVIENASRMNEQQVELTGVFRGWKGCPSSAMITRSDWVLEDESGCIYVSGIMPEGVSPTNAQGEQVRVRGRVVVDAKGKPTIKLENTLRMAH